MLMIIIKKKRWLWYQLTIQFDFITKINQSINPSIDLDREIERDHYMTITFSLMLFQSCKYDDVIQYTHIHTKKRIKLKIEPDEKIQHTHTGNKQTKKINDNRFTLHTHLIIDFERKKNLIINSLMMILLIEHQC